MQLKFRRAHGEVFGLVEALRKSGSHIPLLTPAGFRMTPFLQRTEAGSELFRHFFACRGSNFRGPNKQECTFGGLS